MACVVNCDLDELGDALNSGELRFELVRSSKATGSFRESFANFVGEPQDTVARCSRKCERCCVYIRKRAIEGTNLAWQKTKRDPSPASRVQDDGRTANREIGVPRRRAPRC
jgi:hypothetical protein